MELFEINGGRQLMGEIDLQGSKNSALPIIASTLLIKGVSILHNCPDILDVRKSIEILEKLGAKIIRNNKTLVIDTSNISCSSICECDMRAMRCSIIYLGALISRCGEASIFYPGGCEIGTRPIDLHLKALKSLGVSIVEDGSSLNCSTNRIRGAKIILPFPSVGATENIIIASVISKGKTTIINPAREPEIVDLASFLNKCGARIYGAGETTIEIDGVDSLYGCEHTIIPDRIVASTYMSAAAITSSNIVINNVCYNHLIPIIPIYNEMGCKIYLHNRSLQIEAPKRLKRVKKVRTMPYPGFPTDCQSLVIPPLAIASGTSVIEESIFENRFRFISELNRFGADIECDSKTAIINGVKSLKGASVNSTDLRGGAALVISALGSQGKSKINYINYIDRGYEKLDEALTILGADIRRVSNEKARQTKEKTE